MDIYLIYQKDKQDLLMATYLTPNTVYRSRVHEVSIFIKFSKSKSEFHARLRYQPNPFFPSPKSIIPICEIRFFFLFVNDGLYNRAALTRSRNIVSLVWRHSQLAIFSPGYRLPCLRGTVEALLRNGSRSLPIWKRLRRGVPEIGIHHQLVGVELLRKSRHRWTSIAEWVEECELLVVWIGRGREGRL